MKNVKFSREEIIEASKDIKIEVEYEQRTFDSNFEWMKKKDKNMTVLQSTFRQIAKRNNTLDEQRIADYYAYTVIVNEDTDYYRVTKVTIVK